MLIQITVIKANRKSANAKLRNKLVFFLYIDSNVSSADRENSVDLIRLDISRTFPSLCVFQKVTSD